LPRLPGCGLRAQETWQRQPGDARQAGLEHVAPAQERKPFANKGIEVSEGVVMRMTTCCVLPHHDGLCLGQGEKSGGWAEATLEPIDYTSGSVVRRSRAILIARQGQLVARRFTVIAHEQILAGQREVVPGLAAQRGDAAKFLPAFG
jgi:hypothetical protein